MVGWFGFTIFKALRKETADHNTKKKPSRPIVVETSDDSPKPGKGSPKKKVASPFVETKPQEGEYFSYETMSDRDFAKEFGHTAEETAAAPAAAQPAMHLGMDEESVFNGVVWSEILKRKY